MSGGAIRLAFAVIAIAFFAGPYAVRLVGVAPEAFENRRLAEAPNPVQGWSAFQQTTRYLVDRLPLRAEAVRANTRIWTDVFGADPPYARNENGLDPRALPFAGSIDRDGALELDEGSGPATARSGRAGWLFLDGEFEVACEENVPNDVLLRRWGHFLQVLRRSGRETTMFVVPAKASVYPEYLPERYPFDHCALEAKDRLWHTLSREGPALGVHALRDELLRRKANAGDGLFQRIDSHWTTLGALTAVAAVLDRVGDGVRLRADEVVKRGSLPYTGDLSRVGGDPRVDAREEYGIERAADAPRVPGRTLIICDSFFYRWFRLFKPYFEDVRYVSWYETPYWIDREIRTADRVIVEGTELLFKREAKKGKRPALLADMLESRP